MNRLSSMFRKNLLLLTSGIVLLVYFLLAAATEGYSLYCRTHALTPIYAQENPLERYAAPSSRHWLGTDYLGRDVLLRAAAGSATALKVGLIAGAISAFLGTLLGAAAGYCGGKTDAVVVWLYSTFASLPSLLFILAFALLFSRGYLSPKLMKGLEKVGFYLNAEPGMLAIYFAIGITGWVTLCRVVRGETMKLRTMPYVAAAKVEGMGAFRIILKHILPNVMHLVIIYFTLRFAYAVMTEVIVSYLGFGAASAPSWGVMIANGQERLWRGIWWEVAGATVFMFFLVLALNIMGDGLRDALDPKQKH